MKVSIGYRFDKSIVTFILLRLSSIVMKSRAFLKSWLPGYPKGFYQIPISCPETSFEKPLLSS